MKCLWFPEKACNYLDKVRRTAWALPRNDAAINWLLFRARFFVFGREQLT